MNGPAKNIPRTGGNLNRGNQVNRTVNSLRSLNEPFNDVKAFHTLRARAARVGHAIWRSDADDGNVQFFSSRRGLVKRFESLKQLEAFVHMIGG